MAWVGVGVTLLLAEAGTAFGTPVAWAGVGVRLLLEEAGTALAGAGFALGLAAGVASGFLQRWSIMFV